MKTRTLLLLSVGVGLMILLAGGVLLLQLATESAAVEPADLGESVRVGDVDITVFGGDESDTFYSVDVSAKLDLFRAVADRDSRPRGISCRHTLLTEPVVRELASRGLLVVAWTVDDPHRARQLVDWGVHGITTHRVAEMRAEFVPRP